MKSERKFFFIAAALLISGVFCLSGFSSAPETGMPPPGTPPAGGSEPQLLVNTGAGEQKYHAGEPAQISLGNGESAQVGVDCAGIALYLILMFGTVDRSNTSAEMQALAELYIIGYAGWVFALCERAKERGHFVAADRDLWLRAASINSGPVVQLTQGSIRLNVVDNITGANVETETASISVNGSSDFNVSFNHSTRETIASSTLGSVTVQPKGAGLQPVTLNAGQEVRVGTSSMSAVGPTGSTASPGTGTTTPPTNGNPPAGTLTRLDQFDTDRSCALENPEFFAMIDSWSSGAIDNALFFAGVDAWLGGTNVCASSASLSKRAMRIQQFHGSLLFEGRDPEIDGFRMQIFDVSGSMLFDQWSQGKSLAWNEHDQTGRAVSNGVYFYRLTTISKDGIIKASEIKRLYLLR